MKRGVILIIRDGWGYRKDSKKNAIASAKLPYTEYLMSNYPVSLLKASGKAVGLKKGYQGNSEVGHLTIGSGRILEQSLTRINKSIKDKSFFENGAFLKAIDNCKKKNTTLHLIGLLQSEGVHSHENHLFSLIELCKQKKLPKVCIHIFTDGRDSPINDSLKHIKKLNQKIKKEGIGEISTISGRYYAMDRDKRWNRTKKAYETIVEATSEIKFEEPLKTVRLSHTQGISDEFIIPRVKSNYKGFEEGDSLIFFNFRTDRTRQLMQAFSEKNFPYWKRKNYKIFHVAMTQYYKDLKGLVAFEDLSIKNNLGKIISKHKGKQLRISETEKYAHVTFFFNSQIEKPEKGEKRILIPSPKVATYDLKPEMSVKKIASSLIKEIEKTDYSLVVVNLVNGDMVGHTGNSSAIILGLEAIDRSLEKIVKTGLNKGYKILICGDHGNAEDQRKRWKTSHTINPVPCILVSEDKWKLKNGSLKDLSPTVLDILGMKKPDEMTGNSLIKK